MQNICVLCKGYKMLCGKPKCPRVEKFKILQDLKDKISGKEVLFGESPPAIFVGRHNYPNVFVGPLVSDQQNSEMLDSPEEWIGLGLDRIVGFRTSLFRSKKTANVYTSPLDVQEIALADRGVDTELYMKKRIEFRPSFDSTFAPVGPSGEIKKFRIAENPHIPRKVDYVVSDELKAADAMWELYIRGITVNHISKILSSGALGLKRQRMVPTRWSITAADDSLGKMILEKVRHYELINEFMVFRSDNLGNHYEILLLPNKWEFEQIEMYIPGGLWVDRGGQIPVIRDYEGYRGRKTYASNVSGAYYSARLAVCEYLDKIKRQASALVVREIRPEYWAPVGVWQVRENCRKAFESKPQKFSSLEQALTAMDLNLKTRRKTWESESEVLKNQLSRNSLLKYIGPFA